MIAVKFVGQWMSEEIIDARFRLTGFDVVKATKRNGVGRKKPKKAMNDENKQWFDECARKTRRRRRRLVSPRVDKLVKSSATWGRGQPPEPNIGPRQ